MALTRAGIPFRVHTFDHDPATASFGLDAAEALGVEPARVFKTLFVCVDGRLVVGVVPVSGQLDLKAVAAAVRPRPRSAAEWIGRWVDRPLGCQTRGGDDRVGV